MKRIKDKLYGWMKWRTVSVYYNTPAKFSDLEIGCIRQHPLSIPDGTSFRLKAQNK